MKEIFLLLFLAACMIATVAAWKFWQVDGSICTVIYIFIFAGIASIVEKMMEMD